MTGLKSKASRIFKRGGSPAPPAAPEADPPAVVKKKPSRLFGEGAAAGADAAPGLKKKSSLSALKTKGSGLFSRTVTAPPAVPPVPPLPSPGHSIATSTAPRHPALPATKPSAITPPDGFFKRQRPSTATATTKRSSKESAAQQLRPKISRPTLVPAPIPGAASIPPLPATVAFKKPPGPPPPRPARGPDTLDPELQELMQTATRTALGPCTTDRASSGFPSAHSSTAFADIYADPLRTTPRKVRFSAEDRVLSPRSSAPNDIRRPLPRRLANDADAPPREVYDAENGWSAIQSVTGAPGRSGTLWRSGEGGYVWVRDI